MSLLPLLVCPASVVGLAVLIVFLSRPSKRKRDARLAALIDFT